MKNCMAFFISFAYLLSMEALGGKEGTDEWLLVKRNVLSAQQDLYVSARPFSLLEGKFFIVTLTNNYRLVEGITHFYYHEDDEHQSSFTDTQFPYRSVRQLELFECDSLPPATNGTKRGRSATLVTSYFLGEMASGKRVLMEAPPMERGIWAPFFHELSYSGLEARVCSVAQSDCKATHKSEPGSTYECSAELLFSPEANAAARRSTSHLPN